MADEVLVEIDGRGRASLGRVAWLVPVRGTADWVVI